MIIVKFQGALGNQMFEYAFIEKLKKVYPLNDIYGYVPNISDFNGYELEKVFNINVNKASWKQVARLSNDYPKEGKAYGLMHLFSTIARLNNGLKESHIREDDNSAFYNTIFELDPLRSYYLDGVWANSKYIDDIRDDLLDKFKFRTDLDEKNLELSKKISSGNSVCIHVRRNEYVTMGLTVVSDLYYKKAISYVKEKVESPVFYIFSDDHEYCKKLFDGLIDYTLVEENKKENSYKDLQLMTYCKHNIIANSTFSFWGAYLGTNNDKVVVAPNLSWGHMRSPFARNSWKILDIN